MIKPLELPITLRTPESNEVPVNSSVSERLEKRKTANIVEGYTINFKENDSDNENLQFKFYSEINIDNSKLWELFICLSDLLPEKVALLSGHIDAELNFGNYCPKWQILEYLKKYEKELVGDTFMNFGLVFHSDVVLIEIFIDESKYIKFWGLDEKSFKHILQKFNLQQVDNLEFVDEYPKVREPLRLFIKDVLDTDELIEILKNEYQ